MSYSFIIFDYLAKIAPSNLLVEIKYLVVALKKRSIYFFEVSTLISLAFQMSKKLLVLNHIKFKMLFFENINVLRIFYL